VEAKHSQLVFYAELIAEKPEDWKMTQQQETQTIIA
jgi:hypothetical protein